MKRKAYILSTIYPVINIIASLILYSVTDSFAGRSFFASGFICGIVAVGLVIMRKVDISAYIAHQTIALIISFAVCFFGILLVVNFPFSNAVAVFVLLVILACLVLINVYFAVKTKSFEKWLVLFLTHPIMHFVLFWVGFWYSLYVSFRG